MHMKHSHKLYPSFSLLVDFLIQEVCIRCITARMFTNIPLSKQIFVTTSFLPPNIPRSLVEYLKLPCRIESITASEHMFISPILSAVSSSSPSAQVSVLALILTDYPLKIKIFRGHPLQTFYKEVNPMLYTERIKALRSDHDLNQTQVAKAIHVAQTTYSDYEKGKKCASRSSASSSWRNSTTSI